MLLVARSAHNLRRELDGKDTMASALMIQRWARHMAVVAGNKNPVTGEGLEAEHTGSFKALATALAPQTSFPFEEEDEYLGSWNPRVPLPGERMSGEKLGATRNRGRSYMIPDASQARRTTEGLLFSHDRI